MTKHARLTATTDNQYHKPRYRVQRILSYSLAHNTILCTVELFARSMRYTSPEQIVNNMQKGYRLTPQGLFKIELLNNQPNYINTLPQ